MKILLTEVQIQKRIGELAEEIANDYRDLPTTIVGVLTGSLMFLADLVRRLDFPLRIGLIQASSYRGATTTAGELRISPDLIPDVKGRHVVLLDDILDTGQTMHHLVQHMHELGALTVKVAVLLRKEGRQTIDLEPAYHGFDIPDAFVIGYGLDFNDEHRHLPYIAELPEEEQPK